MSGDHYLAEEVESDSSEVGPRPLAHTPRAESPAVCEDFFMFSIDDEKLGAYYFKQISNFMLYFYYTD
jgi:hypothetical protein